MMFQVYKPNTGICESPESLAEIERNYVKTSSEKAEKHWSLMYDLCETRCSHTFLGGNCKTSLFRHCEVMSNYKMVMLNFL